jgi:expansin (peptidoglycan-binding protein)
VVTIIYLFMMKLLLLLVAFSSCALLASATCTNTAGSDPTMYPVDYTTTYTGDATYYGAYTSGGACTLDPTPPVGTGSSIWTTVALATNLWAGSEACGMCISLTGNGVGSGASPVTGTHIVYVNNECPSCGNNGIDLGMSGDGVWDITWNAVPCPISTNIQFLLQGDNNYYIKLQIRNTRYPVYAVSILQNGAYHALARTSDNFFTAGPTVTFPLAFPLGVQVTSVTGDIITDSVPSLTNGAVMQGSTQFLNCASSSSGSGATTAASATTTTTTGKAATTTTTTTTGKASTTTTGTSSTTGSKTAAKTYIYQNSVNTAAFQDWSWATVNPSATSPVYTGCTNSYGFVPDDYNGAYFHCATNGCISPGTNSSIQFEIYSPVALTSQIAFALIQNSAGVNSQPLSTYSTIPATTWTAVTVPLSNFAAGNYDGLWFQENQGVSQPEVYFANIVLVGK